LYDRSRVSGARGGIRHLARPENVLRFIAKLYRKMNAMSVAEVNAIREKREREIKELLMGFCVHTVCRVMLLYTSARDFASRFFLDSHVLFPFSIEETSADLRKWHIE